MEKKKQRTVRIGRKETNEGHGTISPEQSKQGGINLPSVSNDPFKDELKREGYEIISENEFGVLAKKKLGKSTFMIRTANGYLENEKPSTVYLPESIKTAMKIHIASSGINEQQFIAQLIIERLRENGSL